MVRTSFDDIQRNKVPVVSGRIGSTNSKAERDVRSPQTSQVAQAGALIAAVSRE